MQCCTLRPGDAGVLYDFIALEGAFIGSKLNILDLTLPPI